jgi:hypothetical protein
MNKKTHDLHFVINEKLYNQLSAYATQSKKSVSSTVTWIINKIMPFIEKNHISFQDKDSKYQLISNLDENRHDIHLYVPEEFYRKMKQMHNDNNVFSIGQIIRNIIDFFFKALIKYGIKGLIPRLNRILIKWNKNLEFFKSSRKYFHKQMSYENNSPPHLLIFYDTNSSPYMMKFI